MNRGIDVYLNKMLRVSVIDGRIFEGFLICTDRDMNLVLNSVTEYTRDQRHEQSSDTTEKHISGHPNTMLQSHTEHVKHDENEMTSRQIGMITISGKHIVDITESIECKNDCLF